MQLINSFSSTVGRAIDWTVDSSWGVGYWQSLPPSILSWIGNSSWQIANLAGRAVGWCWESRVRLLITSYMVPFFILAPSIPDEIRLSRDMEQMLPYLPSPTGALFECFIIGSIGSWLWETRLISRPLTGALMREILANGAVIGLDAFCITPPKSGKWTARAKNFLSYAWILYRILDISLTWGNSSDGLVRLNFDPTLAMVRRLAFWTPN